MEKVIVDSLTTSITLGHPELESFLCKPPPRKTKPNQPKPPQICQPELNKQNPHSIYLWLLDIPQKVCRHNNAQQTPSGRTCLECCCNILCYSYNKEPSFVYYLNGPRYILIKSKQFSSYYKLECGKKGNFAFK